MDPSQPCTAFEDGRRLAAGPFAEVSSAVRPAVEAGRAVLICDDETGGVVDLDLRPGGASAPARGPGRPKLGVAAREVTLLPRHWDWLARQPGGASATLRRLVETARREADGPRRQAQDAAYRFATVMAGNAPGYEEAMRALFAADRGRFETLVAAWPADVAEHATRLAAGAFAEG